MKEYSHALAEKPNNFWENVTSDLPGSPSFFLVSHISADHVSSCGNHIKLYA